ncbi:MAG: O-antigen ligase family protein [Dehalococcoidia bacterium]
MSVSTTGELARSTRVEGLDSQVIEVLRLAERLALGALIVLSPLRARLALEDRSNGPIYGEYVDFVLYWSDVAFIALLVLWAVRLRLQPKGLWLGPMPIRLAVAGLVVAASLSVPFSFDVSLSAYDSLRLTAAVFFGLYVANEVRGVRDVLPAVALMVVLQAAVSAGQVVAQGSLGLQSLGENRLDPDVNGTSIVWTAEAGKLLRGYGLTDHPNILGGVLSFGLLVLATGLAGMRQRALLVSLIAVFGLGVAGLALSFSRSGELSFALGFLLVAALLVYRRHSAEAKAWLAAGVVGVVVGGACLLQFSEYIGPRINPSSQVEGSPEQRSLDERSALVKEANGVFLDRPLTGAGIGALPVAIQDRRPQFEYNFQPVHVVLLDVAAETGILGAFFYGMLLVAPWGLLWHRRQQLTPELISVSGALAAVTVVGFLDYYTWGLAPGRIWSWLILGLWLAAYRRVASGVADA